MSDNNIEKLFERMNGTLDTYEPSANHEARFIEKLQKQNKVMQLKTKKRNWYKSMAIAASIALLIGIVFSSSMFDSGEEADLASVSPQMEETQNFFTSAIQLQLEEINKVSSTDTNEIVTDALSLLEKLESDYEDLKRDLVRSGNDKRVISAMIKNFQKRANLLDEVLQKINDINKFKLPENENPIL